MSTRYTSSLYSKLSLSRIIYWIFYVKLYLSGIKFLFAFLTRRNKKFIFKNREYNYFIRPYNATYNNERSVEIPIVLDYLNNENSNKVLEVGNVLSHYVKTEHIVIDKFEKAKRVINADALDYSNEIKFDLIFSISTMEHVGWDDDTKDPLKVIAATNNLKSLLSEKGSLIVTAPIGYNPGFDENVYHNRMGFSEQLFLKRINSKGDWIESEIKEINNSQYNKPFPAANLLFIGIYKNHYDSR